MSEQVTHRIVREVAQLKGEDPATLPVLFDEIDGDALNRLVESSNAQVVFRYAGCEVVISGDGSVAVKGAPDE